MEAGKEEEMNAFSFYKVVLSFPPLNRRVIENSFTSCLK
jgi:hypothetical protein